jgi:hypothetical protein
MFPALHRCSNCKLRIIHHTISACKEKKQVHVHRFSCCTSCSPACLLIASTERLGAINIEHSSCKESPANPSSHRFCNVAITLQKMPYPGAITGLWEEQLPPHEVPDLTSDSCRKCSGQRCAICRAPATHHSSQNSTTTTPFPSHSHPYPLPDMWQCHR